MILDAEKCFENSWAPWQAANGVNLVNAASEDGDNDYNSDGLDKSFIIQNELDLVPYYWGARTSQNIFVG